jgi:hypothetical protein
MKTSIADVQVHFTIVQAEEGNSGILMFLYNEEYFGDSSIQVRILNGYVQEPEGEELVDLNESPSCTQWKGLAAFSFYPVIEEANRIELLDSIMRLSSRGTWEQEKQEDLETVFGLDFRLGEGARVRVSQLSTD